MSTKGSKRILLESLEIDEKDITLGVIRQKSFTTQKTASKFKIATFYATDVELRFNQIETQLDLHQIHDDDERYSLTCAQV